MVLYLLIIKLLPRKYGIETGIFKQILVVPSFLESRNYLESKFSASLLLESIGCR